MANPRCRSSGAAVDLPDAVDDSRAAVGATEDSRADTGPGVGVGD